MQIANPIYDVIFKYLMEDIESAKALISAIIEKEIISLTPMPQERVISVQRLGFTIFRLDFKAIIKTDDGQTEKILIELQKARTITDISRFRRYLGENYMGNDEQEGIDKNLPITCIYFIGYTVPIKNAVIKNEISFKDLVTREPISSDLDLLTLLSHKSIVIFVKNLAEATKNNVIFDILEVFNQHYILGNDKKWILDNSQFDNEKNEKAKQLIMRLHQATQEVELIEKARYEEEYNKELDDLISRLELSLFQSNSKAEEYLKEKIQANLKSEEYLKEKIQANLKSEEYLKEKMELEKQNKKSQIKLAEYEKLINELKNGK